MHVRLTQIDGKLPNLALMKLARHYRDRGHELHFTKHVERDMLEPQDSRAISGRRASMRSGPADSRSA